MGNLKGAFCLEAFPNSLNKFRAAKTEVRGDRIPWQEGWTRQFRWSMPLGIHCALGKQEKWSGDFLLGALRRGWGEGMNGRHISRNGHLWIRFLRQSPGIGWSKSSKSSKNTETAQNNWSRGFSFHWTDLECATTLENLYVVAEEEQYCFHPPPAFYMGKCMLGGRALRLGEFCGNVGSTTQASLGQGSVAVAIFQQIHLFCLGLC